MHGDPLFIRKKHQVLARRLLAVIPKGLPDRPVIAISGISGSGKSTLAHVLCQEIGRSDKVCKIIHTDNFYRTEPLNRTQWRVQQGLEKAVGPDEYNMIMLTSTLDAFRAGTSITMPYVDLHTQYTDSLTTDFAAIDILLIEGLYAIGLEDVDVRIFIDASQKESLAAQKTRSKEQAGKLRIEILRLESMAVHALRDKADIIIDDYKILSGR